MKLNVLTFISKSLLISIPFLFTMSCDKENEVEELNFSSKAPMEDYVAVDKNDYSKVNLKNGLIEFEDYTYYESLINDGEKVHFLTKHLQSLNFESFAKTHPDTKLEDEFIGALLDKNQIVKIGKWFIKVDMSSEKVYASSDMNGYDLVLNGRDLTKIHEFSMDQDVFEYLNNEELLYAKGLF